MNETIVNETIAKFGYPATCIHEWQHWVILLRAAQPTLGSCILAAKGDATEFSAIGADAFAELGQCIAITEAMLGGAVQYDKINYLMLMMVDPHVHFHVIPRFAEKRLWNGIDFVDAGWPKTPELGSAIQLSAPQIEELVIELRNHLPQSAANSGASL
jgi:diadenosine tetraphosphate (Ap4A) HIT family hydrolase